MLTLRQNRAQQPVLQAPPLVCCDPNIVAVNWVFLYLVPYVLGTSIHSTDVHASLIAALAASGFLVLSGLLLYLGGGRRIWPYLFELAFLVVMAVQLGVSYPESKAIQEHYTFITNAALATITLVTLVLRYPLTLQHVREGMPRSVWRYPQVYHASYVTTTIWLVIFVLNTLLYLVPVLQDKLDREHNVLNLLFRIILPICFFAVGTIVTRLYPSRILAQLAFSQGFDSAPVTVHHNPLAS